MRPPRWTIITAIAVVAVILATVGIWWFARVNGGDSADGSQASGDFSERDLTDVLPAPGTDTVEFEPADSTVLVAPWPGAVDETGGGSVSPGLTVVDVEVDDGVFDLFAPEATPSGDQGWEATITLDGDFPGAVDDGFLLPPGHDVFPEGVSGVISDLDTSADVTVVTLRTAPLDQLFTELHIAYRDIDTSTIDADVDGVAFTPGGGGGDGQVATGVPTSMLSALDCSAEASDPGPAEVDIDPGESTSITPDLLNPSDLPDEWSPAQKLVASAIDPTLEMKDFDTGLVIDISWGSAPYVAFQVGWTTEVGVTLRPGVEATCSLSEKTQRTLRKTIPLGTSGAMMDFAPALSFTFSAQGSVTSTSSVRSTAGFEFADGEARGYRTNEDLGNESSASGTVSVSVAPGIRSQLSVLTFVGGYLTGSLPLSVEGTTEGAGDEALCFAFKVGLSLELGLFLDYFFDHEDVQVLAVSISPLFTRDLTCAPDEADPGDAQPDASPPPTTVDPMDATWCVYDDPTDCFSLAEFVAEAEDSGGGFYAGEVPELGDERESIAVCYTYDGGDGICSMASMRIFEYLPVGAEWDCSEEATAYGDLTSCDPDFTVAHDAAYPRMLILPNHQQGDQYVDTPPYYQQQVLPLDLPDAQEDDGGGTEVDPADYERSPNPPTTTYAFATPEGGHSCAIVPAPDGGAVGSVSCVMMFGPEVDVPTSEGAIAFPVLDSDGGGLEFLSDSTYAGAMMDPPTLPSGATLTAYGVTCTVEDGDTIVCEAGGHTMTANAEGYGFG